MENSDLKSLAEKLGLSASDIEKAATRLVKQRIYRKEHPKTGSGTKWADLSDEAKEKRKAYQKTYVQKRNGTMVRLTDIANEVGISVEELLDRVEEEFLGVTEDENEIETNE